MKRRIQHFNKILKYDEKIERLRNNNIKEQIYTYYII